MLTRWLFAAVHLLALGIGLGSIWGRARALTEPLDAPGMRRVFFADAWWGVAAVLWLGTGLPRAFGGLEKGTTYYLHNHLFHAKLGLFVLIFLLEIWPMITLVRWRVAGARGGTVDTSAAPALARISYVQAGLVGLIVLVATALARGYGF
jgi:putative membrane protein